MTRLRVFIRRISGMIFRRKLERKIESEISFHLEMQIEDNLRLGMSPAEARLAALRRFGGIEQVKEKYRDRGGLPLLESALLDLRYAGRMLRKSPVFTAVTVLTLALGIGANTAIFSVINSVLLNPLPFPQSEQLVAIGSRSLRSPTREVTLSYPEYGDLKDQNHAFETIGVYLTGNATLTGLGDAISLPLAYVSPELLLVLRCAPQLGRNFNASEDKPGGGLATIISDSLWRRQFNARPDAIGRVITLNSKSFTIIGVMPPGFRWPIQGEPVDLWTTITEQIESTPEGDNPINTNRGISFFRGIARLRPGVSASEAQADMDRIEQLLTQRYTDQPPHSAVVKPLLETLVGDIRRALILLFAAVGFVLLVACANVSNLLLARLTARQKEINIRVALGASLGRIVRQFLTENLLLSCLGGGFGLILAYGGINLLLKLHPAKLPRLSNVTIDRKVLGFAFLTTILTAILFGIAPAIQIRRRDATDSLKNEGRGGRDGKSHHRIRQLLIVGEIALTLILLTGTSLLLHSLYRLQQVNPGFNARNVLTFNVTLPDNRYSAVQARVFYQQLLSRLRVLPGVSSATGVLCLPFGGTSLVTSFEVQSRPMPVNEQSEVRVNLATPGYFHTMQIPIKFGREFAERDGPKAPRVAVVNETLARQFFPGENPLGRQVKQGIGEDTYEIVGVAGDARSLNLTEPALPEIYVPFDQLLVTNSLTLVMRTEIDPQSVIPGVRNQVHALDGSLAIIHMRSIEELLRSSTEQQRFNSLLISIFGGIALILVTAGLYGVISYSVAQRTSEIGIRLALGAQKGRILKMVIGRGLRLSLIGIALGLAGAAAVTRLLASLLFDVSATDPATFVGVPLLLIFVAGMACYFPARRATRIDPILALKCE